MPAADFELRKRQIEAQLADYAREIDDFAAFMAEWRAREPLPDLHATPDERVAG